MLLASLFHHVMVSVVVCLFFFSVFSTNLLETNIKKLAEARAYLKGSNGSNKSGFAIAMPSDLFISSVEEAVSLSLSSQKCLVVYNALDDEDSWLDTWLKSDSLLELKDQAIWLKLKRSSEQFKYFEQLFPSVVVPSIYVIKDGKIVTIIQGNQASTKQLADALGVSLMPHVTDQRSFKDQVEETTQRKHLEEVRKQKQIAKEEKERILKLVKADRAERRAFENRPSSEDNTNSEVHDNIKDMKRLHAKTCVLMIRLTNSSTLTSQFDSQQSLNDVRKWVDEHRTDGDCLYAFHRSIPRVTFAESDELKSLEALELLPRSVLLLKPLENSFTNVAEARGPGLLGKVFTGLSSWLSGGNNAVGVTEERTEHIEERDADASGVRISTNGTTTQESEISPHASVINNEDSIMDSPVSSRFESPAPSVAEPHINSNPSDLNLPSRCVTPNIYQFVNKNDDEKEKSTYNGNAIKLEKKKDDE